MQRCHHYFLWYSCFDVIFAATCFLCSSTSTYAKQQAKL